MAIVNLAQKRKEESVAKIRTACLLIDSAIDQLCDIANPRGCTHGATAINHLREATGNLVPGTGMLGAWIECLEGE